MDITHALLSLRPGAKWQISGNDYSNLEWLDKNQTKPSSNEVDQELVRLEAEYISTEYQRLREPEYPSIGDQLDALWKGGAAAAAMLEQVQAVKAKYPKGSS
jgi:hypothetical protein